MESPIPSDEAHPASLIVVDPSGNRTTMPLKVLPFKIGRQTDNHLVLRDSRTSRYHARIVWEGGEYQIEDLESRHGVILNGQRVERHRLKHQDKIEFGVDESYQLIFVLAGTEISRLLNNLPTLGQTSALPAGAAGNLAKLRAVMEVARALQTSLSIDDILASVVDAALLVTGTERGFLLLRDGGDLRVRVARDRGGVPLAESDLGVPRRLIHRALETRRELLSMQFDPAGESGVRPEHSVADLDLRAVVCVPLVRIRVGSGQETKVFDATNDTVGVLYMDSRAGAADLSAGNRELLQTLALEASTILENARLLEEEQGKQKIDKELSLAREIQRSLAPASMPSTGWLRACGYSVPSYQVSGDSYDVIPLADGSWAAAVADVSGKGVSSALLACFLQGAFATAANTRSDPAQMMGMLNRFLFERTGGEKYATVFCCTLEKIGLLRYVNCGHCAPILVAPSGELDLLDTTGFPVGLLADVTFESAERWLSPGHKLVIYSDGVTEAHGQGAEFYGLDRLRTAAAANASASAADLHKAILTHVAEFTQGTPQADDVTLVVLEYRP
ncbi:MAG: SpoIIE family protein phosphatase [Bryobacteraceae bacterium]